MTHNVRKKNKHMSTFGVFAVLYSGLTDETGQIVNKRNSVKVQMCRIFP